ncbi:hypothetical protein MKX01_000828 [Papaver californicum]|nr:hypothetical protein MKX01_000828 [Papaver californicum]
MQELAKKGSDPIWWTSSGSQNPQRFQLGFQQQDQDSSSTQSTGQSHHEVSNMSGDHSNRQCVSAQSGIFILYFMYITYGKQGDAQNKSILSLGNPEFVFPRQVDYARLVAHLPYPYIDPYYNGIVTSYGPQAIVTPFLPIYYCVSVYTTFGNLNGSHKLTRVLTFLLCQ